MSEPTAVLNDFATELEKSLASKIAEAAARLGSKVFDRAKVGLEIGFTPFLKKSFERCRFYKTLLDPYAPCDLDKTYVHVNLENKSDRTTYQDLDIIDRFVDGEKFVITGLAGCGKSMFMRLATLRCFESKYTVPVFFELRKLNDVKSPKIVEAIFNECAPPDSGVTLAQFRLALKSGLVALVLDGFDEVEYDLRRDIANQIGDLFVDYPNCPSIISSRPDTDTFVSWQKTTVLEVEKFDQRQTIELIQHARYDHGVKKRFEAALDRSLFVTHGDFLKSPLLTIIMLLTYEEFAEIPNKMHAFYARAFDTLFQKHDADKDQFVRKIKTKLSREDFKLIFSCFCAISYLDEKFSFKAGDLEKYVSSGIRYAENVSARLSVSEIDYITDLRDAVCLIQEDGTNHVFVHRSFQEYFTASFLDKVSEKNLPKIADRLAERLSDNVLPMALDMAREKLEGSWILPKLDFYIDLFNPRGGSRHDAELLNKFIGQIGFYELANRNENEDELNEDEFKVRAQFDALNTELLGPLELIFREYKDIFKPAQIILPLRNRRSSEFRNLLGATLHSRRKNAKNFRNLLLNHDGFTEVIEVKLSKADSWWIDKLNFKACFDEIYDGLIQLRKEIEARSSTREVLLNELLN